MPTLIAGGGGLIGSEIARQLDEDVVIFDVESPADPPAGAATVEGDVADLFVRLLNGDPSIASPTPAASTHYAGSRRYRRRRDRRRGDV